MIEAGRPRLTQTEKGTIKGGGIPAEWKPARHAEIDRGGSWTIKRGKKRSAAPGEGHQREVEIALPVFGYKNHWSVRPWVHPELDCGPSGETLGQCARTARCLARSRDSR